MSGLKALDTLIPGARSLLASDTTISAEKRAALYAHIEGWQGEMPTSKEQAKGHPLIRHIDEFCDSNLRLGPSVTLASDEAIGTAKDLDRLAVSLEYQGLNSREARKQLERAAALQKRGLEQLKNDYGSFKIFARAGNPVCIMWSFRDASSPKDPLAVATSNAATKLLLCRLGAGYTALGRGTQVSLVSHKPASGEKVAQPTVLDAGPRNWQRFKIGGETTPDDDCREEPGVKEVVHYPVEWRCAESLLLWSAP